MSSQPLTLLRDAGSEPSGVSPAHRKRFRWGRLLLFALGAAALALVVGGLWLHSRLAASLPQLAGRHAVAGLEAPVRVERDALGVPMLHGASRLDLALATGFVHAQDRFFQMDLSRRQAAGELAELFGEEALADDRRNRVHRFRAEARRVLYALPRDQRALIEAYSAGVNAGLAALEAEPFEYVLLRVDPIPWRPEDTVLVVLSMFIGLQGDQDRRESRLGLMHDLLPVNVFAFLTPRGTEWDAPMIGGPLAAVPIPGPELLDLRAAPRAAQHRRPPPANLDLAPPAVAASNGWAVAAGRSRGGALLANDMHLALSLPNTWYRASLRWPGKDGSPRQVTGATLPGTPLVVVGSNGRVAWGFTNSLIDTSDLVVLESDPRRPGAFRGPAGAGATTRVDERIRVRGREADRLQVAVTPWGPVIGNDHRGRPLAQRWVAHDVGAVDLELVEMENADDVREGLAVARRSGVPALNVMVADRAGSIGWTIAGVLPRREGFDGMLPTSWADGRRGWRGHLAPEAYPEIVDPASGRIWTANNRVAGGEALARLGDGGYDLGARALQIRNRLFSLEKASVGDMLAIQLDDEAVFLRRWRQLLLRTLGPESLREDPRRAEVRRLVEAWGGHAAIDSAGYALVRGFRQALARRVFEGMTAPCMRADAEFSYYRLGTQFEAPLWKLVSEQPVHLLDPQYRSWHHQLLAAADAARDRLLEKGGELADQTWGRQNVARIQHPFSRALPFVGRWLDMPAQPLPGDAHMPRFQQPTFGASQRMVVSPGREREGIFHMPGGQSGHPFSPHYGDSNAAWAEGRPTPFLPGPAQHTLTLVPVKPGRPQVRRQY